MLRHNDCEFDGINTNLQASENMTEITQYEQHLIVFFSNKYVLFGVIEVEKSSIFSDVYVY